LSPIAVYTKNLHHRPTNSWTINPNVPITANQERHSYPQYSLVVSLPHQTMTVTPLYPMRRTLYLQLRPNAYLYEGRSY